MYDSRLREAKGEEIVVERKETDDKLGEVQRATRVYVVCLLTRDAMIGAITRRVALAR